MIYDITGEDLYNALHDATERLRAEKYVRVLAHYDGDGVSSSIILLRMLERLDIKYHLSYIKNLDNEGFRVLYEEEANVLNIIVDAGSSQIPAIAGHTNFIVLDHHFYNKTETSGININARDYGINGTREACGATMAYMFALVMDEKNRDLFPFFMSGVMADKQDIGGLSGINRKLFDEYNTYQTHHTLNMEGNLLDAITYSIDPFFTGLTGHPDAVKEFLGKIKIDPERNVIDLTTDENKILANTLALKMLENGVGSDAIKYLEGDVLYFDDIGFSSKELNSIIDGNARIGMQSLPVQYFLGDNSVSAEMIGNAKIFKTKLIDYIYRAKSDLKEEKYLRYFYAPESEMAGPISGAIALYAVKPDKPVIGFNVGTDDIKISSRGSRQAVSKGLNLSEVMKAACAAAGGSGGGHDIAAGGVIPRGKEKQFLDTAGEVIKSQIKIT
ncbi:DHH family phosphoesterase [Ferroplasma sp.]|uniref:DHH family phosphoesterase n=1 Tax=Ferroplasma sp. TaxID=2591003 RepID=UPI0026268790|nr:DHH family phosphoesterase [Ferroplasma sp.]